MSKSKKKSSEKSSSYDAAFFIRLAILLGVALILAGGAWYDRAVLVPSADAKIKEISKLETSGSDDSRQVVADTAGMKPTSTTQVGSFAVHEFSYGRILPFLEPRVCTVVFNKTGGIVETYTGPMAAKDREALAARANPVAIAP